MKKNKERKLTINKETLRRLDLQRVTGGGPAGVTDTCNSPCTSGNTACCTTGPCNLCVGRGSAHCQQ